MDSLFYDDFWNWAKNHIEKRLELLNNPEYQKLVLKDIKLIDMCASGCPILDLGKKFHICPVDYLRNDIDRCIMDHSALGSEFYNTDILDNLALKVKLVVETLKAYKYHIIKT